MPATSGKAKQYRAVLPAAPLATLPGASVRLSPQTPGRVAVWIQNTGANALLLHFKDAVQGDGSDFSLAAGAFFPVDLSSPCPTEAINVASVAGTTVAIMELVE